MQANKESALATCARNVSCAQAAARDGFNKTLIMYPVNVNHKKRKNEATML